MGGSEREHIASINISSGIYSIDLTTFEKVKMDWFDYYLVVDGKVIILL